MIGVRNSMNISHNEHYYDEHNNNDNHNDTGRHHPHPRGGDPDSRRRRSNAPRPGTRRRQALPQRGRLLAGLFFWKLYRRILHAFRMGKRSRGALWGKREGEQGESRKKKGVSNDSLFRLAEKAGSLAQLAALPIAEILPLVNGNALVAQKIAAFFADS